MRYCAITSPSHKMHSTYFFLAHDFIAHGLIVAQINSTQVVMFLEKAQFFSRTNFFFQGIHFNYTIIVTQMLMGLIHSSSELLSQHLSTSLLFNELFKIIDNFTSVQSTQ